MLIQLSGRGRSRMLSLATALACVLLLLILPATASALTYTVDSIGDEADEPAVGCETSATTCTLRAAIEESNNSESVDDTILFDNVLFNGQQEDTIVQGASFPELKDTVEIDADAGGATGGRCTTESTFVGPCAGIKGQGLIVAAPAVKIEGLSVIEAAIGIRVEGSGFVAENNWFGVKLNGTNGANTSTGVLALGVDGAQIGGKLPAMRNVFGWSTTGLVLRGTTNAKVQGNYFGAGPDGATSAPQARTLVIADSASNGGIPSEDTLVGADVGMAGDETPACDLGCNVFVNAGGFAPSVDLRKNAAFEEEPATGPTTIQGNYIGLTAAGTEAASSFAPAINVGSADDVTIGGPDAGDANQIHGGTYGVLAGELGVPAKGLVVENNSIGRALDDSGSLVPPGVGVFVSSEGLTAGADRAEVLENRITASTGIELHSFGALAEENTLSGGVIGIHTFGSTELSGNTIKANSVSDTGEEGILLRNDNNEVVANTVTSAGKAGIRVFSVNSGFGFPIISGNVIGGDGVSGENIVSESAGDAIEISDVEESQNEIRRNRGSGNSGNFIDLVASALGEKGPNEGIVPPAFAVAQQSGATGTSLPNATVRIFRKANGSAGELDSFIAEALADGTGNWKVTYPAPVPTGTLVAATQTNTLDGTSELVTATSAADPSPPTPPSGGGGGGGSGGAKKGAKKDPPGIPDTKINKGPKKKSAKTTAKFKFSGTSQPAGFECRLDKKRFAKCSSPKAYKKLKPGKHTFEVRAFNAGGKDPTPAKYKFTVLE